MSIAAMFGLAIAAPVASAANASASPRPVAVASHQAQVPPKLTWSKPLQVYPGVSNSLSCATATFCLAIQNDGNDAFIRGGQE